MYVEIKLNRFLNDGIDFLENGLNSFLSTTFNKKSIIIYIKNKLSIIEIVFKIIPSLFPSEFKKKVKANIKKNNPKLFL